MVCFSCGCCNFGKRSHLKKGSKTYSIVKMKCPKCHEGKFFVAGPYNLRKAGDTFENCSVCDQRYSIEPGFYFGALYLAYFMGAATIALISIVIYLANNNANSSVYIGVVAGILVLAGPYYYALSKIMWANMFIHYQDELSGIEDDKKTSYES